jgi:copper chaperone
MTKLKLNVKGMSCAHCENAVVKAVSALDGVQGVKASAKKGFAKVKFDETKQTKETIAAAIRALEYEVAD